MSKDKLPKELTTFGVQQLYNSPAGINQSIVVQAMDIYKKEGIAESFCTISDGFYKFKAVIYNAATSDVSKEQNCIIEITQHAVLEMKGEKKAITVIDCRVIAQYEGVVGSPIDVSIDKEPLAQATNLLNAEKMKVVYKGRNESSIIETRKEEIMLDLESSSEEIPEQNYRDYEKISDLYVDLPNWELICRIISKTYKEFNNRNGKLTKIMNLELIDRVGMKIEGVMFGDNAKTFYEHLKENHVYKVSRGQIREESYKINRGPKYSRNNILFTSNSIFRKLKDVSFIPLSDADEVLLSQVIKDQDFDMVYNIVAILTSIKEEVQLEKQGKQLFKQNIYVCDPVSKQIIESVLWNRNVPVAEDLIGKAVLMKGFKLNDYLGSISLNSTSKSRITKLQSHAFCAFEDKLQLQDFDLISGAYKSKSKEEKILQNFKELEAEVEYMDEAKPLITETTAWVSHMNFKNRFFYDACPKCKKKAESSSTCLDCQTDITETISRFILSVELSDYCGSIWTTAFDEFGQMIFKETTLEMLKGMNDFQLREESEKRSFQEFSFRIQTKKTDTGQIKHNVIGKPREIKPELVAMEAVKRSKEYL